MAIQVVPTQSSPGQEFGKSLATGLGSQLSGLGGKAIGSGLGSLATGLGQLTGLSQAPKKLTKEVLTAAGFSEADADLILSAPEGLQSKLLESIAARPPVEQPTKEAQPKPAEEQKTTEGEISPAFKKMYQEATGKDFDSTLPGTEEKPMGDIEKPLMATEKPKSALFRPTAKEAKAETNRLAHVEREEEALKLKKSGHELQREKFEHAKEEPTRKEIRETVKGWHKDYKSAKEDKKAYKDLKSLTAIQAFTPSNIRRFMGRFGFGEYFLDAPEQTYNKIVEGLVQKKASELASQGKMTAALFDRVRMRFPSLYNTREGQDVLTNLLMRESDEKEVYNTIYNRIRKEEGWAPGHEPLDIVERVNEEAEPILEKMRDESNIELQKDIEGPFYGKTKEEREAMRIPLTDTEAEYA